MSDRSVTPERLVLPALGLGIAGDVLFHAGGLGANVPLWFGGMVFAWWQLRSRNEEQPAGMERQLLLGILLLAGAFAWREGEMLRLLDTFALGVMLALLPIAADPAGSRRLGELTVERLLLAMGYAGRRIAAGLVPPLLAAHRQPDERASRGRTLLIHAARGLVLAVPIILLFGALLGSADPRYQLFLTSLLRFDVDVVVGHFFGIGVCSWLVAAMLAGAVLTERRRLDRGGLLIAPVLGPVEILLTLGLLDLLFGGFVVFQVPYFFGGSAVVLGTEGLTLARYAREGFFQLVAASGLVLPLLLVLERFYHRRTVGDWRLFQVLAGTLLALLAVVMGSAMHRMALYQLEFGLTADRFYASALLGGIAVTGVWFSVTVLRSLPGRFVAGSLLAWAAWLAALHVVNPEAIVVRTNLRRMESGRPLDTSYLTSLSSDAVPTIVAGINGMPESDRTHLVEWLRGNAAEACCDWRGWHYGRNRARAAVRTLDPPSSTSTP